MSDVSTMTDEQILEQIKQETAASRIFLYMKGTPDMPWASVSFYLNGSRFNVAELNAPENPKGTIFSANRDYGRFGAFPKTELKADQPLTLRYRFFVREGQDALTADEVQRLFDDFAKLPKVTVKP